MKSLLWLCDETQDVVLDNVLNILATVDEEDEDAADDDDEVYGDGDEEHIVVMMMTGVGWIETQMEEAGTRFDADWVLSRHTPDDCSVLFYFTFYFYIYFLV